MSAEAIARLRKMVDDAFDGSSVSEQMLSNGPVAELVDDLRALLDAHAEALDALEDLDDACAAVASWSSDCIDFNDPVRERARAVLAKAGRR